MSTYTNMYIYIYIFIYIYIYICDLYSWGLRSKCIRTASCASGRRSALSKTPPVFACVLPLLAFFLTGSAYGGKSHIRQMDQWPGVLVMQATYWFSVKPYCICSGVLVIWFPLLGSRSPYAPCYAFISFRLYIHSDIRGSLSAPPICYHS